MASVKEDPLVSGKILNIVGDQYSDNIQKEEIKMLEFRQNLKIF